MDPVTMYGLFQLGQGIFGGIMGKKRADADRRASKAIADQQRRDAVQSEGYNRQVAARQDHWRMPFVRSSHSALQDLFPGTLPPMDPKAYDPNFLLSRGGGLAAQTFGEFNARERQARRANPADTPLYHPRPAPPAPYATASAQPVVTPPTPVDPRMERVPFEQPGFVPTIDPRMNNAQMARMETLVPQPPSPDELLDERLRMLREGGRRNIGGSNIWS
jgi:hypothetical protein